MPCCVRVTVVSRKCMFECEYSCSNFIVGWEVFRWLMNVCRLSSPCVQTTKMSSMYRFQIRGWRLFGLLSRSLSRRYPFSLHFPSHFDNMVHRTRYKIITPCLSRLYTRIYPRSSPALKFHLQTTILIHRMRGSAL